MLVCSEILHSTAKAQHLEMYIDDSEEGWTARKEAGLFWENLMAAGDTGPKWTPSTKMFVFTQIRRFAEDSTGTTQKSGKIDFVKNLSRFLSGLCKDKGFSPDIMQKIVELAFKPMHERI